jgi:hypothetical protein
MIQEDRQEDADREMVVRWNLAAMTLEHGQAAEQVWI